MNKQIKVGEAYTYDRSQAADAGNLNISWIGDPYAATKFDSRYAAKLRIREIDNIPQTRVFKELEVRKQA